MAKPKVKTKATTKATTKAKATSKPAVAAGPVRLPFKDLWATIGKSIADPAVVAALGRAGKVSTGRPDGGDQYVIAKAAGFDLLLRRPEDAKRGSPLLVHTVFLYAEGNDGHRQFAEPPFGVGFGSRTELLARMPLPQRSWLIGKGEVPVTRSKVSHDRWLFEGLEISAHYGEDGMIRNFQVAAPADK